MADGQWRPEARVGDHPFLVLQENDRLVATTGRSIPNQVVRKPCARIEPDSVPQDMGLQSLQERWSALTAWLPLAGASGLERTQDGRLRLVDTLIRQAPWMANAALLIGRQLETQLWLGRPWFAFRPILIVGPPGSGKSRFAADVARAAGVGHIRISLAGVSDAKLIEGTARGWTGTQPSLPALAMAQARTANPVIVVDEADKAGGNSAHGRPLFSLLNMLEEHTAREWYDPCLLANVDIGAVNWILTANSLDVLPAPLLSRVDVIHTEGPMPWDFGDLLGCVLQDLAMAWGMQVDDLPPLHDRVENSLYLMFCDDRSARALGKRVEAALQSVLSTQAQTKN